MMIIVNSKIFTFFCLIYLLGYLHPVADLRGEEGDFLNKGVHKEGEKDSPRGHQEVGIISLKKSGGRRSES